MKNNRNLYKLTTESYQETEKMILMKVGSVSDLYDQFIITRAVKNWCWTKLARYGE
jgi:peptidyl-tRNA hydrolase